MQKQKKLMITAGGTGGHIFPAMAVAEYLQQQGWQIEWLGREDKMEAELVPKYGIPISFIQVSGLRGRSFLGLMLAPFMLVKAVYQAIKILRRVKPDVVLGMGGYVSGPGGLAARLLGIPLVIHEQNAVIGLTNNWLAKIASKVLQAFPNTFTSTDVVTVGNPIRQDLLQISKPNDRYLGRDDALHILILGGSQGSGIINQTIPAMCQLLNKNVIIHHQVGKGNKEKITALYPAEIIPQVSVFEFIDDMKQEYNWADLVICRSGALTVSEIATVGLAAIFIPFQHKDRQQYLNAKHLADLNAAMIIEQQELSASKLADQVNQLDRNKLLNMATQAQQLKSDKAAILVADYIQALTS